ncbi:MAG: hypothetical protein R3F53_21660 [Gammaproteobacteria bacterium]
MDGQAEIAQRAQQSLSPSTPHICILSGNILDISTDESVTLTSPEPDATARPGVVAHGSGDGGSR